MTPTTPTPPSEVARDAVEIRELERKSLQLCNLAGTMMLACKRLLSVQDRHADEGGANICFCDACKIELPDLSDVAVDRLIKESNAQAAALDALKAWREAEKAHEAAMKDESALEVRRGAYGNGVEKLRRATRATYDREEAALVALRTATDALKP